MADACGAELCEWGAAGNSRLPETCQLAPCDVELPGHVPGAVRQPDLPHLLDSIAKKRCSKGP